MRSGAVSTSPVPSLSLPFHCLTDSNLTALSLSLSLSLLSSHEVERLGRHSEIPGCIWSPSYSGWTVQAGPGREVRGGGVGGCEGRGVSWVHCPALYRGRRGRAQLTFSCPADQGAQAGRLQGSSFSHRDQTLSYSGNYLNFTIIESTLKY